MRLNVIYLTCLGAVIPLSWFFGTMLSEHVYSLESKFGLLRNVYPDLVLLLFFIGGLMIVVQLTNRWGNCRSIAYLLLFVVFLLVVYFLPPSPSIRVEIIFRSYLAIIGSMPFKWVKCVFSGPGRIILLVHGRELVRIHLRQLRVLPYIVLAISVILFSQPYLLYASRVPYWSNISEDEYLAAEWIRENSSPDSYILTDPSTGWVFRGLTLRNCSTAFIVHGNMPSPRSGPGANLSWLIYSFLREEDPLNAISCIRQFSKVPDYIVVTTRTSAWVSQQALGATFCSPTDVTLNQFPGMSKFSASFFPVLRTWKTVIVYGLVVPPGWASLCDTVYCDLDTRIGMRDMSVVSK